MPLAIHKDLCKATGVEHCVRANLTDANHINLVVAKGSILEIYRLREGGTGRPLIRLFQQKLYGNVESIAVIRFAGRKTDSLCMAFLDAKMSVIEFDLAQNKVVTMSMHDFDETKFVKARRVLTDCQPILRVDPENRCVGLFVCDTQLIIFPCSAGPESFESGEGAPRKEMLKEHFFVDANNLEVGTIKDFIFLNGTTIEPAVLLLCEKKRTWEGRFAVSRHSCELISLSLNLSASSHSVVARADKLPHSSFKLVPVPTPLGGALILSSHLLFHWNNQTVGYALSFNSFGDKYPHVILQLSEDLLKLDLASCIFISPLQFVLSTLTGDLYLGTIDAQSSSVKSISLSFQGSSSQPVCACVLNSNHFFLGSRLSSSVLIEHYRTVEPAGPPELSPGSPIGGKGEMSTAGNGDAPPAKKQKTQSTTAMAAGSQSIMSDNSSSAQTEQVQAEATGNGDKAENVDKDGTTSMLGDKAEDIDEFGAMFAGEPDAEHSGPKAVVFNTQLENTVVDHSLEDAGDDADAVVKEMEMEIAEAEAPGKLDGAEDTQVGLTFRVRDAFVNIGPISHFTLGYAPKEQEEEEPLGYQKDESRKGGTQMLGEEEYDVSPKREDTAEEARQEELAMAKTLNMIEFVGASGHGKDSILSICNQGVRAISLVQFPFGRKITGCWTVRKRRVDTVPPQSLEDRENSRKEKKPRKKDKKKEKKSKSKKKDKAKHANEQEEEESKAEVFGDRFRPDEDAAVTTEKIQSKKRSKKEKRKRSKNEPPTEPTEPTEPGEDGFHSYLVVATTSETMVLTTDVDLQEDDTTDFLKSPTIGVGNMLGSSRAIVQVHSKGVRLLDRGEKVQDVAMPVEVVASHILDPYILVLLNDGTVRLVTATAAPLNLSVSVPLLSLLPDNESSFGVDRDIKAVCLYLDDGLSGLFETSTERATRLSSSKADESSPQSAQGEESSQYLCIICRAGMLEIYRVPTFERVFWCRDFSAGFDVLKNEALEDGDRGEQDESTESLMLRASKGTKGLPRVEEVCFAQLGAPGSCPFVISFLSNGDLLVYQAFTYEAHPDHAPIRLSRIHHNFITRDVLSGEHLRGGAAARRDGSQADAADASTGMSIGEERQQRLRKMPRLQLFGDVSGRRGILIGGKRPAWVFAERDFLRIHPFIMEQLPVDVPPAADPEQSAEKLACSTSFNNVNCDSGFIYFDGTGTLNISQLPPPWPADDMELPKDRAEGQGRVRFTNQMDSNIKFGMSKMVSYDAEMAVRKIVLGYTIHQVVYHEITATYAVVVSKKVEGYSMEESNERSLPVYADKYEVLLYSAHKWEVVGRFDGFKEFEVVLCVRSVKLSNKHYIAMGTSNHEGEDTTTRGRTIILELYWAQGVTVVQGIKQNKRILKVKVAASKLDPTVGPVTQIADLEGVLACCIGSRMILYALEEDDGECKLVSKAFYDCQAFVVSIQTLKNFILVGDIYRSVYFIMWDSFVKQLTLLATDYERAQTYSSHFLVDGKSLSMVLSDQNRNLQLFQYLPDRPESFGGRKLLPSGDFHVGAHINNFELLSLPSSSSYSQTQQQKRFFKHRTGARTALVCGQLDGGYSLVAPVDEIVYRRLDSLQTQLTYKMQHIAGLNPRAFRAIRDHSPSRMSNQRNIADGSILWEYFSLDCLSQYKLANNIGTTPDRIIANLQDVDWSTQCYN